MHLGLTHLSNVHASLISIAHLLCTCMCCGGRGWAAILLMVHLAFCHCILTTPHHTLISPHTTKHHLHQMLLYSLQHQLPTRSVLHHDDPYDLPQTVELHCPGKERRNKGITDAHKKGEQFESEYEEEK